MGTVQAVVMMLMVATSIWVRIAWGPARHRSLSLLGGAIALVMLVAQFALSFG